MSGIPLEHVSKLNTLDNQIYNIFPRSSIYDTSSAANIKEALTRLQQQELLVQDRLGTLVTSQKNLAREFGRLDVLRARLGSHTIATRSISNGMLSDAASAAKRISNAVKKVDLEQNRVRGTLGVVEQVVELKACVLGVTGSMGAPQDWETAAMYLSRASKIPKDIIDGSFAEELVPTAEVPDPPRITLENAAESLRGLFLREFEGAAQEGNGTKVTRFFKLFPLIGKSDVGLDVYGRYVCQGVASRVRVNLNAGTGANQRKDSLFYANALTKLFEHIAQIVEHHGGLVEGHYGAGRMVRVIERLQLEADVQGGIIIDTWSDERNIDRKLTDIRSYAFSFLVQSFLPGPTARNGTPRASSPATTSGTADRQAHIDESIDMKDIDELLCEISLMLGRWSLYSKFIAAKCKDSSYVSQAQIQNLSVPRLLLNSPLSQKIAEKLILPFNAMTTFFFRRSVEKAFQLDEQPQDLSLNPAKHLNSNAPYITTAVDDVMFVVNQIVERCVSTSQSEVVSIVIPSITRVLGSDFIGMIQRKMRDESYPKAAVQGALPSEQTIISFLVLINNLDIATQYIKRIVQPHVEQTTPTSSMALYPFNQDATLVTISLKSLEQSFAGRTFELITDGLYVTFKNVIKPRLRPVLADSFRDIDYQLTEEDIERLSLDAQVEDGDGSIEAAVQRRFQRGWDALTKPIARLLTDQNYGKLLTTMISYLSEFLEKRIWSFYGRMNYLGAVRLERDIASIINVAVKGGKYGLRDAFARCTQICLIMNMDEDEWEEVQITPTEKGDREVEWRIDGEERIRARRMARVEGM